MNYALGIPKGLRMVLEERGVNTKGLNEDEMREILGAHPDFKNEVTSGKVSFGGEAPHCLHAA